MDPLAKALASMSMALMEHGHVQVDAALELASGMPLGDDGKRQLRARIQRWFKGLKK